LNTATPFVLMALVDNLGEAQARLLNDEGQARMTQVAAFIAKLQPLGLNLDGEQHVGVVSTQFIAEADVLLDDIPYRYYSHIVRAGNQHHVLARSRGVD
jgi:Type II secretion system (T2SS), protein K